MTENDIKGNVYSLVESYKKLATTKGSEKHSHEIVAEHSAILLVTQVLIDINRIANALEEIAKHAE